MHLELEGMERAAKVLDRLAVEAKALGLDGAMIAVAARHIRKEAAALGAAKPVSEMTPEECADELTREGQRLNWPQEPPADPRLELWDAINEYAQACGGDTSYETSTGRRMDAVVRIEQLVLPRAATACPTVVACAERVARCAREQSLGESAHEIVAGAVAGSMKTTDEMLRVAGKFEALRGLAQEVVTRDAPRLQFEAWTCQRCANIHQSTPEDIKHEPHCLYARLRAAINEGG